MHPSWPAVAAEWQPLWLATAHTWATFICRHSAFVLRILRRQTASNSKSLPSFLKTASKRARPMKPMFRASSSLHYHINLSSEQLGWAQLAYNLLLAPCSWRKVGAGQHPVQKGMLKSSHME